jgi:hypothetical protein
MILGQVTLGAAATQISTHGIGYRQLVIQNNATHDVRYGDSTVTATRGILLNPGGSSNEGAISIQGGVLSTDYLFGTSGDVIDFAYLPA